MQWIKRTAILGVASLIGHDAVYTDSTFGERVDLLDALGVKHSRSTVRKTAGYCNSQDAAHNDQSYQILKKHQVSVPTSSIFVDGDGNAREFPEEFSIISVLKLKKKKKNSNLFTVWDSNGRQQFGINIGKEHTIFYQDDGVKPEQPLMKYKKMPGTKMLKTHDGDWHRVAWSVGYDEDSGRTRAELWVDCRKVSEITFERSPFPRMTTGGISVLGREMMGDNDVFVGNIQQLDLYDDPTAASYMCEPHLALTPNCDGDAGVPVVQPVVQRDRALPAETPDHDTITLVEVDEQSIGKDFAGYEDITDEYTDDDYDDSAIDDSIDGDYNYEYNGEEYDDNLVDTTDDYSDIDDRRLF
jgi:hypothetical protein